MAGTGTATPGGTAPARPSIDGLQPVMSNLQDAGQPFASATVDDPTLGALDSITITPSGAAGVLAGVGLTANQDGTYTLTFATPQALTRELDALTFAPTITNDGPLEVTSFSLNVTSSTGAASSASNTYTVDSTPNQNLFGSTTTSASSLQGEVYALYEGLLGRAPDQNGAELYVAQLENGFSLDRITQGFLNSTEAFRYFSPGSGDAEFVNDLYQQVLGRTGEPGGVAYWEQQLASGTSRSIVADDFVFSPEHIADMKPALDAGVFIADDAATETARLYYGLLDRAPDAAGLAANTRQLRNTGSPVGLAQFFLDSSEYAADNPVPMPNGAFVNALYQNALGRAPSADEGRYYTNLLNDNGASRALVTVEIVQGSEARQHLAGRIENGYHVA